MTYLIVFLAVVGALSLAATLLVLVGAFIGSRVHAITSLEPSSDDMWAEIDALEQRPYNHEVDGL